GSVSAAGHDAAGAALPAAARCRVGARRGVRGPQPGPGAASRVDADAAAGSRAPGWAEALSHRLRYGCAGELLLRLLLLGEWRPGVPRVVPPGAGGHPTEGLGEGLVGGLV